MKASRIWAFIISLVICLSVTAPAYADASQTKVTVKKGDTVYGICQSLGLDYNICKNTIMRLNGMEKESELTEKLTAHANSIRVRFEEEDANE